MKKTLVMLFALLLIATLAGCKGECKSCSPTAPNVTCTLSVSSGTQTTFTSAGGSGSFNMTTSASSCGMCTSVTTDSSWITLQTSGGTVSYTVASYTGNATRTGTVTMCGIVRTITQTPPTTQVACAWGFPPTTPTWPAAGETSFGVGFTSTCVGAAWSVAITSNPGDMLFNLTPSSGLTAPDGKGGGKGDVTLNKRANTGGPRVAILTWTTPDGKFTTQVPQDAAPGK